MLCQICLELILQIDHLLTLHASGETPTTYGLPHHHTVVSVVDAVENVRCVICTRAAHEAPGLVDRDLEQWLHVEDDQPGLDYNALANLSAWQRSGEISLRLMTQSYGGLSSFRLRALSDSTVETLQQNESLRSSSRTDDDEVLGLAHQWLSSCEASHDKCRFYFDTKTTYPARLLDLEPDGFDDDFHFRLIEGQAMQGVSGGYITLSHRWGPPERHPPKLSAATYESLVRGWPIKHLSGTYRDAVKVIKKLNVRYMWVDSLCIFQDEQLDILTEALNMASVYGNAVCNISALEARQDGLFDRRDATLVAPRSHVIFNTDHPGLQRSYAIGDHRLWETSIFDAPLSKRGWILQEQLLARRTLFFGHKQLLWSCLSGAWCETYPMEGACWNDSDFCLGQRHLEPVRLYCAAANRAITHGSQRTSPNPISPMLKRDFQMAWRHVIEEYVPRQLTERSDKLLAITGIVSSFSATQDDECVGGHWTSSFPFNLLWHVSSQRAQGEPSSGSWVDVSLPNTMHYVPTWSWASQHGRLIIPGELDRRYCAPIAKVLGVERKSHVVGSSVRKEDVGALTLVCPQLPLVRIREGAGFAWELQALATMPPRPSPDPLGNNTETYFEVPDSKILTDTLVAAFISCEVHISRTPHHPHKNTESPTTFDIDNVNISNRKILIRCEGLILQPLSSSCSSLSTLPSLLNNSTTARYRRVGHFKFGEIMTTTPPSTPQSRFMPSNWRFHIDVEERDGQLYTCHPNFDDPLLMCVCDIV